MDSFPSTPRRLTCRLVAFLLAGTALAACGRGDVGAPGGSARDELRRAVEATLASKSFVMHRRVDGQVAADLTIVYQAPDRIRTTDGAGVVHNVVIGRTMFTLPPVPPRPPEAAGVAGSPPPPPFPVPGRPGLQNSPPGTYWRTEAPASGPSAVAGFLAELHTLADADEVTKAGSTFRWRAGRGEAAVSGDAHVDGGRIADFTFVPAAAAWEGMTLTFRVGDYDDAPPVDPPPADKVLDMPLPEPCNPDGMPKPGQVACDPTGLDLDVDREVTLPTPTIKDPSPLQLRPVRAIRAGTCAAAADNPAADQPTSLAGPDGACYDLDPAALTIRHAKAHAEALPGGPDGVTVVLTLDPADAPGLKRLLADNLHKQVAMVMFGRVQSAPTVQDPESDGRQVAVSGIDPQTAADIIKALAG